MEVGLSYELEQRLALLCPVCRAEIGVEGVAPFKRRAVVLEEAHYMCMWCGAEHDKPPEFLYLRKDGTYRTRREPYPTTLMERVNTDLDLALLEH